VKKIGKTQGRISPLPYKTFQLMEAAKAEFEMRYGNLDGLPADLLGLSQSVEVCWSHSSHVATRYRLTEALAVSVAADFDPADPMDFVTLVNKGWITPVASPVIDIREMKQRARDCFRDIGFSGVATIEFDLLLRPKNDREGHLILPHIHAVGHIDTHRAKKTIGELKMSSRLVQPWGCPTVVRKKVNTVEDLMHVLAYPLKLPVRTKRLVPNKRKAGEWKMRTNSRRQVHALARIVEVLSYCRHKDLLFTIGGKNRWLTNACSTLSRRGQSREAWYSDAELKTIWMNVHAGNRFASFGELIIRK